MMWIMFAHAPAPDVANWPGRRWLAAMDAVAWPVIAFALLLRVPGATGLVLPAVGVACGWAGLARLHTAVWANHRYRFTTWRWLRILFVLVTIALTMKVSLVWR